MTLDRSPVLPRRERKLGSNEQSAVPPTAAKQANDPPPAEHPGSSQESRSRRVAVKSVEKRGRGWETFPKKVA